MVPEGMTMQVEPEDVSSLDDWLADARLAETTVLVFGRGDLIGDHQELVADLASTPPGDPAALDLAEKIIAAEKLMRVSGKRFRFRAATADEIKFCEETHKGDVEAISHAMLSVQCVDPSVKADQWARIRDKIGVGQFQALLTAASEVCYHRQSDVPTSQAATALLEANKLKRGDGR
jgi:hypothetical protein